MVLYVLVPGDKYRLTGERCILKVLKMYDGWYHHSDKKEHFLILFSLLILVELFLSWN